MEASSRFWSYASITRMHMGETSGSGEEKLRAASKALVRCCRIGERGQETGALQRAFGLGLFGKINVRYRRSGSSAILSAVPLCPTIIHPQNPMMLTFLSTRWFSGCPGNVGVQYRRRATRPVAGFEYPFSMQLPFLLGFDWVLGPDAPSKHAWKNPNEKVMHGLRRVFLYAQKIIPRMIYVTKGPPYTSLFEAKVLPLLEGHPSFQGHGGRVVVYVGGGGNDGSPDGSQLRRWAKHPQIAAIFAENLDLELEQRFLLLSGNESEPTAEGSATSGGSSSSSSSQTEITSESKAEADFTETKIFSAPLGLCMRDLVTRAGTLVQALEAAPPFDKRHSTSLYGCFGNDHGRRKLDRAVFQDPAVRNAAGSLFTWCMDRPPQGARAAVSEPPADVAASPEGASTQAFWHNASQFRVAFSPFGNGYECFRTFELLAVGCIVVMPYYPGVEVMYEGLPVAFLKAERRRANGETFMSTTAPSVLEQLTPARLSEIEKELAPLARDVDATRRKLSLLHWLKKYRRPLGELEG